jgi:hypothetical protein
VELPYPREYKNDTHIINGHKGLQFYLGWCLQPEARTLMKRISVEVPDRIQIQIQRFDDQKLEKNLQLKLNLYFFDQKLQFTYP